MTRQPAQHISTSVQAAVRQHEQLVMTAPEEKLLESAIEIETIGPSGNDIQYMHSIMCQVGLPRSKVDGSVFERKSGGANLLVRAGYIFDGNEMVQQPVPYGAMPRLMLAWMNTYAVRHKTAEVPVGDSACEFLSMLGIEPSGGKRGSYTTFRKQTQALAACDLTLGFNINGHPHTFYGNPIEHFEAWSQNASEQRALWPGVMTFTDSYFKALVDHAVPLDMRALIALKGSSLAMDIYAMLSDRLHRITARSVLLHWKNLRDQFGQEYKGKDPDKDFKREFLRALEQVKMVYPQAKIRKVKTGLLLLQSPPSIPYKSA
jgi:Plasmid encoded RepA protein